MLNERERKILNILSEHPHIGVSELSRQLEVSAVTVRSDFDALAEKGYLIRTRGGALPAFHPGITARQKENPGIKAAIARQAASMISDGDTVMIEAGTTTALIGRCLLGKRDVRIVTNSTLLLPYARSNPALQLNFTAGIFHPEAESVLGSMTVQILNQFHVKTAFLGTDGFSIEHGLSTHMAEAVEVVQAMHSRSERTVLLADSSKWGQAGFAHILSLSEIDTLITDSGLPQAARDEIQALGIQIMIAEAK